MAYSFDHEWENEKLRLQHLEQVFDPGTKYYINKIGLKKNAICLEVGAGSGSIAKWLSNHLSSGYVVATDIQTQFLKSEPNDRLEIRKHDIVTDPIENDYYDFVHARALLEHLPERDIALKKMITALKPGGTILIESHDMITSFPISEFGGREFKKVTGLAIQIMKKNGFIEHYGRHVGNKLSSYGINNVQIEGRSYEVGKDCPMTMVWSLIIKQLKQDFNALDMISEKEIDDALHMFADSNFHAMSPLFIAGWGIK